MVTSARGIAVDVSFEPLVSGEWDPHPAGSQAAPDPRGGGSGTAETQRRWVRVLVTERQHESNEPSSPPACRAQAPDGWFQKQTSLSRPAHAGPGRAGPGDPEPLAGVPLALLTPGSWPGAFSAFATTGPKRTTSSGDQVLPSSRGSCQGRSAPTSCHLLGAWPTLRVTSVALASLLFSCLPQPGTSLSGVPQRVGGSCRKAPADAGITRGPGQPDPQNGPPTGLPPPSRH